MHPFSTTIARFDDDGISTATVTEDNGGSEGRLGNCPRDVVLLDLQYANNHCSVAWAKPSRGWWLRPGQRFDKAKATLGQAGAEQHYSSRLQNRLQTKNLMGEHQEW